jgi:hypothetical protein
MSSRKAVSIRFTFAGGATGFARSPSTIPVAVTYIGSPWAGPGMKLP